MADTRQLNILGIRGIPAAHGGFESFAARFAPFMRDSGWKVLVYCQEDEGVRRPRSWESDWEGIRRVHFETRTTGALSTMEFDLRTVLHVLGQPGTDLVLGYNTAIFNVLERAAGRRVVMNMDGIEWKRQKWGRNARRWFWANEWIGGKIANTAIADHPEIAVHLATRGCRDAVVIPYASDVIDAAPEGPLAPFGLKPKDYFISIARIEPENSILELVQAFVKADTGRKLMLLGKLDPEKTPYHAAIKAAASADVIFAGAIYDRDVLQALRFHALAYLHGHQVGGTNPSLVEALGAGNAVIAHDNKFNRWTAGEGQLFFKTVDDGAAHMQLLSSDPAVEPRLAARARARHREAFQYDMIHAKYLDAIT